MKIPMDASGLTDAARRLADGLPDRIRSAHREAEQQTAQSAGIDGADAASRTGRADGGPGSDLRAELEEIVVDIVNADRGETHDLLGDVVELIVDDCLERIDIPATDDQQHEICERMRSDPTIVAEIDDILQTIAVELASD